jgi:hypothetical protein
MIEPDDIPDDWMAVACRRRPVLLVNQSAESIATLARGGLMNGAPRFLRTTGALEHAHDGQERPA